jgi:hypothetical protein
LQGEDGVLKGGFHGGSAAFRERRILACLAGVSLFTMGGTRQECRPSAGGNSIYGLPSSTTRPRAAALWPHRLTPRRTRHNRRQSRMSRCANFTPRIQTGAELERLLCFEDDAI